MQYCTLGKKNYQFLYYPLNIYLCIYLFMCLEFLPRQNFIHKTSVLLSSFQFQCHYIIAAVLLLLLYYYPRTVLVLLPSDHILYSSTFLLVIHNTYIHATNNYIEIRVFNYHFFSKVILLVQLLSYCVVYSVVVVVVDLSDSSFVVVTGTGGGYHIDNNAVHTILVTNTTFN